KIPALRSATSVAAACAQVRSGAGSNCGCFVLLRSNRRPHRSWDSDASFDLRTRDLASAARRKRLDGGTEGEVLRAARLDSRIIARRQLFFEPLRHLDDVREGLAEIMSRGRKGVPYRRWGCRLRPAFHDSIPFQSAKTGGQHAG